MFIWSRVEPEWRVEGESHSLADAQLYRKRLIPLECVQLKDDVILECDDEVILTKWSALKPKKDLHHGYSCYFRNKGYKVSKFYTADNTLMYWYCDIVDFDYNEETNELVVTDLLADVIVYPDGYVKVVDIDELAVKASVENARLNSCNGRLCYLHHQRRNALRATSRHRQ